MQRITGATKGGLATQMVFVSVDRITMVKSASMSLIVEVGLEEIFCSWLLSYGFVSPCAVLSASTSAATTEKPHNSSIRCSGANPEEDHPPERPWPFEIQRRNHDLRIEINQVILDRISSKQEDQVRSDHLNRWDLGKDRDCLREDRHLDQVKVHRNLKESSWKHRHLEGRLNTLVNILATQTDQTVL